MRSGGCYSFQKNQVGTFLSPPFYDCSLSVFLIIKGNFCNYLNNFAANVNIDFKWFFSL